MSPRPATIGPDLSTPSGCRDEAVRQGSLANEAKTAGDLRKVGQHIERARELVVLALKLEADEAKEQA